MVYLIRTPLSCDKESEDRVYNACSTFLQVIYVYMYICVYVCYMSYILLYFDLLCHMPYAICHTLIMSFNLLLLLLCHMPCSSYVIQLNGSSKDPETRMLSLYTLNNLMPCIDR
jgi:hypothetical protein